MDKKMTVGVQKRWIGYLGFALLLGPVLASFAQDVERMKASRVVVTRESLHGWRSKKMDDPRKSPQFQHGQRL